MKQIQIGELLNAVMNDLQMNGLGVYPHICDYLHGNAPAPYDYNYIAWNTAEGLIDWDVLDEARDNGDIERYARTVVGYIDESYDRHCEWCNEGADKKHSTILLTSVISISVISTDRCYRRYC